MRLSKPQYKQQIKLSFKPAACAGFNDMEEGTLACLSPKPIRREPRGLLLDDTDS